MGFCGDDDGALSVEGIARGRDGVCYLTALELGREGGWVWETVSWLVLEEYFAIELPWLDKGRMAMEKLWRAALSAV